MKYSPCCLVSAMKKAKTWNGIGFVIMVLHRRKRQMNKYKDKSRLARLLRKIAKMCLNKKAFETEEEAFQQGQRIYQCKHCGKWHRSGQMATFIAELRH